MITTDEKHKNEVKEFYDVTSPFWRDLWGIHVHHGYWKTGKESKEIAQNQLTEELAERVGIRNGMNILDVGCGMGGSSIWLAKKYNAQTIGITLSPVQVDIATKTATKERELILNLLLWMQKKPLLIVFLILFGQSKQYLTLATLKTFLF